MRTHRLSILGFGLTAASITGAAILEVSHAPGAPYATIQSAINAAVPSTDEVYVRCGRYLENVVMRSGVPVRGEKMQCTTIDGHGLGPVVTMTDIVNTKLSGFTIENGLDDVGGGIRVLRGSPVIDGNRIRNNHVPEYSSGYYHAGGISVAPSFPLPAPVITRNVITGNEGPYTSGAFVQGSGRVEGNVFAHNVGGVAALYIGNNFSGTVMNNTIVNNQPYAGIAIYFCPSATIGGNIVANNPHGVVAYPLPTMASNDVFGNGLNYLGVPDQTGLNGNMSVDPQFVSEVEDNFVGFEPRSDSSVTELAGPSAPVELSGLSAPVDGRSTGNPLRDIGARENEGVTGLRATSPYGFSWDPGNHMPASDYNAFRGDLAVLRSTGVYIQDPTVVTGAKHFCDISTSLSEAEDPPPGVAWFYLAAEWGTVYGPLGFDSARNARPYAALHCLSP